MARRRPSSSSSLLPPVPAAAGAGLAALQLVPASGPWGAWAGLIAAGAFGVWSERTRLGRELSGALVATLAGMALANLGYLPPHCPECGVVFKFLLPLAVPLLLLGADLRAILTRTGPMLGAFLLGTLTTVLASAAAYALFPLSRWGLGEEGWKIAAALTARHIGGAVNYVAMSEALGVSPSVFGAGLAADDLILVGYFAALYSLARGLPPESGASGGGGGNAAVAAAAGEGAAAGAPQAAAAAGEGEGAGEGGHGGVGARTLAVYPAAMALAISAAICYASTQLTMALGCPSQALTAITLLSVAAATAAPRLLARLAPSAEAAALLLLQVFFAAVGASANVRLVVTSAPVLFCWSFIALAGHLGLMLGFSRLLGLSRKQALLASNANIGGPSTVAGMAATKGWRESAAPAVLTSALGYAIGSPIGLALGTFVYKPLFV